MLLTLSDFDRVPRILRLNIAGQPVEWYLGRMPFVSMRET